jgi:FdhD protein
MAGIKIICAIGAPSSLAVELAEENEITLVGFLKNAKFNVYSRKQRVTINVES